MLKEETLNKKMKPISKSNVEMNTLTRNNTSTVFINVTNGLCVKYTFSFNFNSHA